MLNRRSGLNVSSEIRSLTGSVPAITLDIGFKRWFYSGFPRVAGN